ncbi:DUF1049 domain-containing protein [bacterium]|nr:DUF1049 domain-containing protein [bacterium]
MQRVKLIGALAGVLLTVILILQNTQLVETKILFTTVTMPNAILLGLALLIGIVIGMVFALILSGKRNAK